MKMIIVVINKRLKRILPPWGKFNSSKDKSILLAWLREAEEEIWSVLSWAIGTFMDVHGNGVDTAEIVLEEDFEFVDISWRWHDSMYFYKLYDDKNITLAGELEGFFIDKKTASRETMNVWGNTYPVLLPPEQSKMRELILSVMK